MERRSIGRYEISRALCARFLPPSRRATVGEGKKFLFHPNIYLLWIN
jgi:hypothetical protein